VIPLSRTHVLAKVKASDGVFWGGLRTTSPHSSIHLLLMRSSRDVTTIFLGDDRRDICRNERIRERPPPNVDEILMNTTGFDMERLHRHDFARLTCVGKFPTDTKTVTGKIFSPSEKLSFTIGTHLIFLKDL